MIWFLNYVKNTVIARFFFGLGFILLTSYGALAQSLTVSGSNPTCLTGSATASYNVNYSGSANVNWTVVGGTIQSYPWSPTITVRWDRTSSQGTTTVRASVTETTCSIIDDPPYEECGWVFDPGYGEDRWQCWWVDPPPYETCNTQTYTSNTLSVNVAPVPNWVSFTYSTNAACEGSLGNQYNVTQTPNTYLWSVSSGGTLEAASGNAALVQWNVPGTQSVTVSVTNGVCTSLPNTTTVNVNPLPASYSVSGGGSFCSGGAGVSVTLSGSQAGVNYQLRLNGGDTGSPIGGTGGALTWSNITAAGNYTVFAMNNSTNCFRDMTGNTTVVINTSPTVYEVSSSGSAFCAGANFSISLSGSQSGVNYQLRRDGVNTGSSISGDGSPISWPGLSQSGVYSVLATHTSGCSAWMSGSPSVSVAAPISVFGLTGFGAFCTPATLILNGSQPGVNYQLRRDAVNVGSAVTGTGGSLSWPGLNTTGTYTVMATHATTGCTQLMGGGAFLTINTLPALFTVGGNETICSGSTTTVTLSGSQAGVNYQLRRDGTNVGAVVAGTGAALSWPGQNMAGSYTVLATNASTTCSQAMTGGATITVNPLPTLFTVGGMASICSGSTTTVTLSGSQTGVNYQLRRDGTNVGTAVAGTGAPLSWAGQNTAGSYTVMATHATGGCTQLMSGSLPVTINPLPTLFTVGGTGTICSGSSTTVTLSGSQTGVNYQLRRDGVNVGTAVAGTGATLSWSGQNAAGTYTVMATSATTGCTQLMTDSLPLVVNPLPALFTVSGVGTICAGASGVTINLSGSVTGVNYQLRNGATNVGTAVAGTGSAISWSNQSAAGSYTVVATNATTTCSQPMTGSATITVNPLPTLFTVGGTASICSGSTTTVTLSGSQTGMNYQLRRDGTNVGTAVAGTGAALNWAGQNTAGSYTIVASNASTTCTQLMTGSLLLTIQSAPSAFTITGGGTICASSSATISLSGSQTGVNYQLLRDGVNVGAAVVGTGAVMNWAGQNMAGTYTVVATNVLAGCTTTMTGSAVITVNVLPTLFTLSATGGACAGTPVTLSIGGSQTGVNYQLLKDGANAGAALAGTGAILSWPNVIDAGVYTVRATNASTGCTQLMTGTHTINSLPAMFTVGGTGIICSGSSTSVTLGGSQTGVNYQLRRTVNLAVNPDAIGTNGYTNNGLAALAAENLSGQTYIKVTCNQISTVGIVSQDWVSVTPGDRFTYRVRAYRNTTGQAYLYVTTGTVNLVWISGDTRLLPQGAANEGWVSVDFVIPAGTTSIRYGVLFANDIVIGDNFYINQFELLRNDVNVGTAVAGTGATLSWPGQNAAGTYTVMATSATTGCTQLMTGSLPLVVNPLPALFTVSGGGTICAGASGITINLSGTETGVNYQLRNGATNVGAAVAGTGSAISWSNQSAAGSYTVVATNATTACSQSMTGSATITVNPLPTLFTVGGTASICSGQTTTVTLSGSQTGVNYQLRRNGTNVGTAVAGTGATLNWAGQNTAGSYTIMATDATTTCAQLMTGSLNLVVNPAAVAPTITGGTRCGTGSVTLTASSASTGTFRWYSGLTGGSPLQTSSAAVSSNTFSPTVSATTTYYVTFTTSANCESNPRTAIVATVTPSPAMFTVSGGGNVFTGSKTVSLSGSQTGTAYQLLLDGANSGASVNGTGSTLQWTVTQVGTFTVRASVGFCSVVMTGNAITVNRDIRQILQVDSAQAVHIPEKVKTFAFGWVPVASAEPQFQLTQLNLGDTKNVFPAPPCLVGNYWIGFQLYYDLGDRQTAPEWLTQLTLSLKQGGTVLWTSPLQINTKNQTFISTNFYTQAVNCGGGYTFQIDQKDVIGPAPATNIYLKVLLYRDDDQTFNPATALQLNCTNGGREINLGWTYPGTAREYDLEWVFIADHEGFTGTTAQQAFQFKEPVRITMAVPYYNHLHFYQNGKLWYRARAVGYHPQFPEHRQLGQWFYTPCSSIAIANQQDDRNWQMQTAFAEDGKTKKVVQYFDGTQRARQSQTNLSTENITVTSETLYDFEGRKSVDILSAPSGAQYNNALTFKPGLNNFAASDPLIVARTSATRKKYHYDNAGAQNSTINTTNGAGLYYSPANTQGTDVEIRKLIPNSEGYVYSQTEYLNDGTGRVKRQSGVGREFRMDGGKATRYFYGSAAPAELKRLFGNTNVGNASHYKKNLVVDANGQVSVSYLDQYDQVIATALAGDKPDALAALPSYIDRNAPPIVVDITANNQRQGDQSVTVHKILNTAPSTDYTLVYDLTAANPSMGELGCPTCVLDLEISVTNPEGELMALGAVPGNQSTSSNRYLRKGISGIGCTPQNIPIQITLTFADIGDYTITKRLVSSELSYEQLKALVTTRADVQTKIQEITNVYNQIDNTKCAICTTQPTACTDAENAIITAFNEIAALDCENIVLQIREDLRQAYLALNPQDVDYEPTQTQIETDARYCQYTLCVKDKESDVFEKLLARVVNWSSAVAAGLSNPISVDPFFNNSALSGFPSRSAMQTRLNQFVVATFNAQVAVPRPMEYVVNPSSPEYYIDEAGNPANTTVGRHMLYKDLMERRSQLTPEAYAAELEQQRWALYRAFYLEEKRKVKLQISGYTACPKAIESLRQVEQIPVTEQGVRNWSSAAQVIGPVSDQQLAMSFFAIKFACAANPPPRILPPDSTAIIGHLRTYFNSNPENFFRLILRQDLATNSSLAAINAILAAHGCNLSTVAEDDPAVCQESRSISTVSGNYVVNPTLQPSGSCGGYISGDGCYTGWFPQSGLPQVPYGDNVIRLRSSDCDSTSSAVGGTLRTAPLSGLVPGRLYRFSVTYRTLDQTDLVFCELSRDRTYRKSKSGYGQFSQFFQNQAPMVSPIPPCNPGGVVYPDLVQINGSSRSRVWQKTNLSSPVSPDGSRNYTTWGANGSFENSADPTIGNILNPGTTYGFSAPGAQRTGSRGLLLYMTSANVPIGAHLARFNFSSGVSTRSYEVTAWVKTPGTSYIVNDPSRFLYLKPPTTSTGWIILGQNQVTFSETSNTWRKLTIRVAVPVGVPIPIHETFTLSSTAFGTEFNSSGSLLVDDVSINPEIYEASPWQTDVVYFRATEASTYLTFSTNTQQRLNQNIEIKDVSVIEEINLFTVCTRYQQPVTPNYLADFTIKCQQNLIDEAAKLKEFAIDKLIESEVSTFSNSFRKLCLDGASETLTYQFTPREYHYTLYYYDQARNLVQTVPPEGVKPLTMAQVNNDADPAHTLITRYQYNSLNQLIYQITPDAGESRFWYDDKAQLRLSQNAEQKNGNRYSYTRYDEQGRVTEVGEMTSRETITNAQIENPLFPAASVAWEYPLNGNLLDASSNAMNGTLHGGTTLAPDRNGHLAATQLNGVDGYGQIPDNAQLDFADKDFTVSFWVKKLQTTSDWKNCAGVGKWNTGAAPGSNSWSLGLCNQANDNIPGFAVEIGTSLYVVSATTSLQIGTWYHLSATKQGNTLKMFVNGALEGSVQLPGTNLRINKTNLPVYVGRLASGYYTNAVFDDVNITVATNTGTSEVGFQQLTDITRTYYDLPNANIQPTFTQQQLRNRVSWVEMLEKGKPEPVLTFYSYDIHGNVRSLLQQLPGLQPKRTDYLYDLVSGKVNFVMYQFGQPDQFVHQYLYDADNRIKEVKTSTDRFTWDSDARYHYYLHGPLARAELGEHRVQGLDYYYTLQGWLKGVNSPTGTAAQTNDPRQDGIGTSKVGRDAFAFNLGYYKGDYAPIGAATPIIAQSAIEAPWPWQGAAGERLDLYNGNIAWMATDLEIIGTNQGNRNAGVQLMQYTYDQLNRIVRSRSRTYNGSLVARTTAPAAYDEDYTYDANGNILTLLRRNQLAAVQDDFTYQYYAGTNRLRAVRPVTEDVVYTGAVTSNTKIYRNITLRNSAYVPAGAHVVLRASERITASPNFTTTGAGSFHALITNEGAYQYDAIGNLVLDRQEGAAISWTPYGKVRQVKTKGDSVVVDFRYDAAGNRVEKRVFTLAKTGATSVALTRYVRDASGNIMAVYADDEVPDVQWAGVTGVTVSGTTLTKGATTSAWDAGLASVQKIPAGGNGWVQTTVGDSPAIDINTGRFFGLSATDADASYIGIQYGLYLVAGGALDVFESGLVRGRFGSYAAGDVLRVERVNTTVYYKRNGVVFYTSTVPSTTELLADFSFFHSGGRLLNVQFNFGEAPTEQPIYGSSRLGQYLGWRKAGQQRLGRKQFELTNHLGNVLAVVTDNINLNATTAWATVVSATDYYPFGLEMAGRSYQNDKYRYGFNGKEKDQKGEFGKTSYDYGFRIYNPTIAKFLSVDPLTRDYPWYTPYQFAGNTPIQAVDVDGLEPIPSIRPSYVRPRTNFSRYNKRGNGTRNQSAPPQSRRLPPPSGSPVIVSPVGSNFQSGEFLQITVYRRPKTKPSIGTSQDVRTPEFDVESGGNSKVGRTVDGLLDLYDNFHDMRKIISQDISPDNIYSPQEIGFAVDPVTYFKLQSLEKEYNAEVDRQTRGNLTQEEFDALPESAKGLRRSVALFKIGLSPTQKFLAKIQSMIKKGELEVDKVYETRRTMIKAN